MENILKTERYRIHIKAFATGTAIVRRHFGDDVSLRELYFRFVMVDYLLDHGDITSTEMAKLTDIPIATVSRYVWSCLTEGRIEETVDESDRRRRLLRLTPSGASAMVKFTDDWAKQMNGVTARLLQLEE